MRQLRPLGRRLAVIRAAAAWPRGARLRAFQRRMFARLAVLRRHGRDEDNALVSLELKG